MHPTTTGRFGGVHVEQTVACTLQAWLRHGLVDYVWTRASWRVLLGRYVHIEDMRCRERAELGGPDLREAGLGACRCVAQGLAGCLCRASILWGCVMLGCKWLVVATFLGLCFRQSRQGLPTGSGLL